MNYRLEEILAAAKSNRCFVREGHVLRAVEVTEVEVHDLMTASPHVYQVRAQTASEVVACSAGEVTVHGSSQVKIVGCSMTEKGHLGRYRGFITYGEVGKMAKCHTAIQ